MFQSSGNLLGPVRSLFTILQRSSKNERDANGIWLCRETSGFLSGIWPCWQETSSDHLVAVLRGKIRLLFSPKRKFRAVFLNIHHPILYGAPNAFPHGELLLPSLDIYLRNARWIIAQRRRDYQVEHGPRSYFTGWPQAQRSRSVIVSEELHIVPATYECLPTNEIKVKMRERLPSVGQS